MKRFKRILATAIALCLAVPLLPTTAFAAGIGGAGNIKASSYIYYGTWKSQPLKWRVLDPSKTNTGASGVLMITEDSLGDSGKNGDVQFNLTTTGSQNYQASNAQAWCTTFFGKSLSSKEQGVVLPTSKDDNSFGNFRQADGILAGDKTFFLSAEEAVHYMPNVNDRIAKYEGKATSWLLRSPQKNEMYSVGLIYNDGNLYDTQVSGKWSARPALNLNLSSVLFSSPATGGKLGNLGEFNGVSTAGVNLKFTILDDINLKLGTATATAAAAGNQATITYTGATPNKALSAIITDNSGTVLQYAKLVATTTADGTAPMTLPAGFNANTMKLKVFVEEANGDNLTDYASKPVEVTVTNVTPPTPPARPDPPAQPEPPTPPTPPPSYIGESFVDNRTTFEKAVDNTVSDINLAKPGAYLTLDMRGNPTLPGKLLNALAGKDVTLTLDMGGGVKWVIRGTDLSRSDYGSLNLSVNAKANTIPVTVINKVIGEVKVMQLALTHNDAFGFTMTMLLETGKENAGLWANLYYFNPTTNALEYRTSGLIDVAGKAAIPFYSASDYAVVIDKRNHGAPAFTDTANHWAKNSIDFVTGRGLLTGTTKTTFSPGNAMTKQMLVTALGRLSRIDTTKYKNTKFTDVAVTANYAPYVAWAVEKGIITGTTDTTFSPDKSISRQELATLMANYAKSTKCTLPQTRADAAFEDGGTIASWAAEAAINMQMAGTMNGKNGNKFDPAGTATRAEVAAVLHRYVELVIDPATAQGLDVNDSGSTMLYEKGKLVKSTTRAVGSAIYSFNAYGEAASIPHS